MTAGQRNIALLIAAGLLIGTGFFVGRYARRSESDQRSTTTGTQKPTTYDSSKEAPSATLKNFFELRREYDELRRTPAGVQWDFVEKAEAYAKKTRDSTDDNDIRTLDLLTDCYLKFGELEDARAAFQQYLDRVERAKGKEEAAKRARDKADQLFYRDNKYFDALSFYELMSHRYPDTDHAAYGQFMVGKYFLRTKLSSQAIEEFAAFAENYPDSKQRSLRRRRGRKIL